MISERLRQEGRALTARADGGCPLLDAAGQRCTVYADRPFGCRTFFCHRIRGPSRQPVETVDALLTRLEAVARKWLPDAAPRPILEWAGMMAPMPLGDRIRKEGLLEEAALATAAARATEKGEDLASAIWALKLLPERTLVRLLCGETGHPGIELVRSVIRTTSLELLPADVMKRRLALPVVVTESSILLAMAHPDDTALTDQLSFSAGRKVLRHVAVPAALRAAIEGCLKAVSTGDPEWRGKDAWKFSPGPSGRASVVHPEESGTAPSAPEDDAPVMIVVGSELAAAPSQELLGGTLLDPAFDAPAAPAPAPAAAADTQITARQQGMAAGKIALVVDDDVDMRGLFVKLLEPFGCAVVQSGDGKEALALCRELRPSVVILDGMLPGMHGFEVCRAIKGDPTLSKTAVLMVSGVHTGWKVGVDVAEVYGADGFFEKPFRPDYFQAAVRRCLLGTGAEAAAAKARREAAMATCREAAARSRAGKMGEALDLLRAATEKDPFSAEPQFYLGQALRLAGDPYQAIGAFERAADLRPDLEPPLTQLGDLYQQLGFKKSAREVFRRALDVCKDPDKRAHLERQLREL